MIKRNWGHDGAGKLGFRYRKANESLGVSSGAVCAKESSFLTVSESGRRDARKGIQRLRFFERIVRHVIAFAGATLQCKLEIIRGTLGNGDHLDTVFAIERG